jgi:hypothetical protein
MGYKRISLLFPKKFRPAEIIKQSAIAFIRYIAKRSEKLLVKNEMTS